MELLSEDDLNLKQMTWEELERAWDLWIDLAQATNDFDPPWTHGVFVLSELPFWPDRQDVQAGASDEQSVVAGSGTFGDRPAQALSPPFD